MKKSFQFSIMDVFVVLIFSMGTNTYAQNSGNGTIIEDLNRVAEEIKEDIAQSQIDAGNELEDHDFDIKAEISAHDGTTTLAHDDLASDHDVLEGKLDQVMETGLDCPTAWGRTIDTTDRFELVMGDEAVLDHETCLVWEQSPRSEGGHDQGSFGNTGTVEWEDALANCFIKKVGGRTGWRLPTIDELATLPQSDQFFGQNLPIGNPFDNIQRNVYWSSSILVTSNTVNNNSDTIWIVDFTIDGNVSLAALNQSGNPPQPANHFNYWCVRGGQGN